MHSFYTSVDDQGIWLTQQKIHPLHLTSLNFYTALSHDTLAREATLKNRFKSLKLAEKYYIAAIVTLTPPLQIASIKEDDDVDSPTSATFDHHRTWRRRSSNSGSFDSIISIASSATSYGGHEHNDAEISPKQTDGYQFPRPPRGNTPSPTMQHHNTIFLSSFTALQTSHHYPLPPAAASFLPLLESHLSSVRELKQKTSVHGVRFTFPSAPSSPVAMSSSTSSMKARGSHLCDDDDAAEAIRQSRRTRVFRERFDPEAVRRLCGDALAELS